MIELERDALVVSFPEVHEQAVLSIDFQRTLRIPDDGSTHFLPPGLGRFPLRHVDDHRERVPAAWGHHGGVMLPMYQSEAMWLNFTSRTGYPFAIKVATGKVSALTGEPWRDGLNRNPQDYVVVPGQPWLDGYVVAEGEVRQFVAMPLGGGYSVEEQLTGAAEFGGVQLLVYPMKRRVWERRMRWSYLADEMAVAMLAEPAPYADIGLAAGGGMRQTIHEDDHEPVDWDTSHSSRCFVHIANSFLWRTITGEDPPTVPFTAAEYSRAGLPWFDYYDESRSGVEATEALRGVRSVVEVAKAKGEVALPENETVHPDHVVRLGGRRSVKHIVREGAI